MLNKLRKGERLVSKKKFRLLDEEVRGGSSLILQCFIDEYDHKWLGKCSINTLENGVFIEGYSEEYYEKCNFEDYKELLSMKLYSLFHVNTPETTLSLKYLSPKNQQKYADTFEFLEYQRMHVMSKYLNEFQLLGENFIENYKQNNRVRPYFHVSKEQIPLIGFGRAIVVAILLHDFDCVGNSGGNMGYIVNHEKKCAEIFKIDPGFALDFEFDDMKNDPKKRQAILGTNGSRLSDSDLAANDKDEVIQTVMEILETSDAKIEEVFQDFVVLDDRFEMILKNLLDRKKNLLSAFSTEVRNLIIAQIEADTVSKAEKLMGNWGNTDQLPFQQQPEVNPKLVLNSSRLNAISFPRNECFVGRDSELRRIKELFSHNRGVAGCAIVGGAGLGKSHLAVEYVNRNREELYSRIIWLNAEQDGLVSNQIRFYLDSFFSIRSDSQLRDENSILNNFYQVLNAECLSHRDQKKKVCIVFDNAENMKQIENYLPNTKLLPALNVDFLITSRYQIWEKPFYMKIEMPDFGAEEIQKYIENYFPNIESKENRDQLPQEIDKLSTLLGGLPLAVSQAIAYIQQTGISFSQFCEFVHEANQKPTVMPGETEKEYKNLNFASSTLTLALANLRSRNHHVEPILDILAYLSPESISESLLQEGWNQFGSKSGSEEFTEALNLLSLYSFITFDSTKPMQDKFKDSDRISIEANESARAIKIHRLTQQVIRLNHQKSGIYQNRCQKIFDWVLLRLKFKETDAEDMKRAGFYIPHAMHLEKLVSHISNEKMADLFDRIGLQMNLTAGNYDVVREYYEKSLEIKEEIYGRDHLQTAMTLNNLGNLMGTLRNFEKMKAYLTRALDIHERHFGKQHPEVAITLGNLGRAWGCLGDYHKEKKLLSKSLKIYEKHYGKYHRFTGKALAMLGFALEATEDYVKKQDYLIQSLNILEQYYGKNHPQIGCILYELGTVWGSVGNYEKQKEILSRVLEIYLTYYGKDPIQTGMALEKLGNSWGALGDYEKQKDFLSQGLEIFEKYYGKDHPETGKIVKYLAVAWKSLGNYQEAADLLTRALIADEKNYGDTHFQTATTLHNLGCALGTLGNYEKQRDFLTRALPIFETYYGKEHVQTGLVLSNLSNAWGTLGNMEKQKELLTLTLMIYEKNYGEEHLRTALTRVKLAGAWGSLGIVEKQKELLSQALPTLKKYYPLDHPFVSQIQATYDLDQRMNYKKETNLDNNKESK